MIDEPSKRPGCSPCSAFCHLLAGTCPPPQSPRWCASAPARCCSASLAQAPARAPHTRLSALDAASWLLRNRSSLHILGLGCPGLCHGMPGLMTFPQGAACKNVMCKSTQCKHLSTAHTPCRCAPYLELCGDLHFLPGIARHICQHCQRSRVGGLLHRHRLMLQSGGSRQQYLSRCTEGDEGQSYRCSEDAEAEQPNICGPPSTTKLKTASPSGLLARGSR